MPALHKKPRSRAAQKARYHAAKQAVHGRRTKHRRFILHPITIFGLLCLGVLIAGQTITGVAETLHITAKVAAPALTQGALITAPSDGQNFTVAPIVVEGSCPADSYVNLYRNDRFSGTAWCDGGSFAISTDLSPGANSLRAQDFNITDDPGPATPAVTVTYSPPAAPAPAVNSVAQPPTRTVPVSYGAGTTELPLQILSDFSFQAFIKNSRFNWEVQVLGGRVPYRLYVEWGDGTISRQAVSDNQKFTINHIYITEGYYPIKVWVSDADGHVSLLQLSALINPPGALGFSGTATPNGAAPGPGLWQQLQRYLWIVWPVYGAIVLMAASFWLGELQQIHALAKLPPSRQVRRTHRRR